MPTISGIMSIPIASATVDRAIDDASPSQLSPIILSTTHEETEITIGREIEDFTESQVELRTILEVVVEGKSANMEQLVTVVSETPEDVLGVGPEGLIQASDEILEIVIESME